MQKFLVFISLFLASITSIGAQELQPYPANDGDRAEYRAMIEMKKGYLSGVCLLVNDDGSIKGAVINEFGITAIDFIYSIEKDKVKLNTVASMLDKWYIRKVLARDLRELLHNLRSGEGQYTDRKYGISYTLSPLQENNNIDGEQPDIQN